MVEAHFSRTAKAKRRPVWVWAVATLTLLALLWAAYWFVTAEKEDAPKRNVTRITVLRPPPPPPPPPPKQEKPPEPPKVKDEVKIDPPKPAETPKPQEAEAPPPGPLGVDAQGTGPGDGFGLAGRPGGQDIVLGGKPGGGAAGALSNATFANGLARHLAQELARDDRLRGSEYRVVMNIWVNRDGRVERWEMVNGSGKGDVDRWLEDGLARIGQLRQPVPEGLPQPLRIRLTSAEV
jgi:periplasmic protein TonB